MQKTTTFIETVKIKGHLQDETKAKDITEVVFRTMRELMTHEAIERVAEELHKVAIPAPEKANEVEIADLWKDTNPVARTLSADNLPEHFDGKHFLYCVNQEAHLPPGVSTETAVCAVFSATKQELSSERVQEVASFLPDEVQTLWEKA